MNLSFFDEFGTIGIPVWIGRVEVGMVVRATNFDESGNKELIDKFGHIVGFARNAQRELLLEVKWDNGDTLPIHPSNVQLLRT
jgi:hypothetical protein